MLAHPDSRRGFLGSATAGLLGLPARASQPARAPLAISRDKYFTLEQRNNHWWFITPEGEPFFSVAMNHIDSSSLRYPEYLDLWRNKYGNSQQRWIQQAVAPALKDWGFNSIGWTQEGVKRQSSYRHSRSFVYEEYQWAGMPYCHLLPFIESHQWEFQARLPDIMSDEFEEFCDLVARTACTRMAEDPKLIGYFYTDCPVWVHSRKPELRGSILDPDLLKTAPGRKKIFQHASHYYKVLHDAIRRYDPNHLILGDRYEGRAPLPDEILKAAVPYVDVLSFQYFHSHEHIVRDFQRWHKMTGVPVLLADASEWRGDFTSYPVMMKALRELPGCVGWHYHGPYLSREDRERNSAARFEPGRVDESILSQIRSANVETEEWVRSVAARS